jgi:hypothetical protein
LLLVFLDVDTAKGDGLNVINPIAPVTVVKQAARDAVSHDAQQQQLQEQLD